MNKRYANLYSLIRFAQIEEEREGLKGYFMDVYHGKNETGIA